MTAIVFGLIVCKLTAAVCTIWGIVRRSGGLEMAHAYTPRLAVAELSTNNVCDIRVYRMRKLTSAA